LKKVIEEEENKPRPNSIGRLLWYARGYKEWHEKLKQQARQEEEQLFHSKSIEERETLLDTIEHHKERIRNELHSYIPLLANRWDRKSKLVQYLSNNDVEYISELLQEEGGVKRLFVESGIINANYQPSHNDVEH